ncbi:MAG: TatD family hydrolase [Nitrososphaerales archaeon]|nr:TatD family hydrolase [Nitrososphaerales archaeon]
MHFVDSHLHLSEYEDSSQVVRLAASAGVRLFSCSVDRKSSERTIAIARENPLVVSSFVGVHPSEATKQKDHAWIRVAARDASGVGEVGLDPKYSEVAEKSPQMEVFLDQLCVAEELKMPVQVHSRNAERLCLDKLTSYRLSSVLLHWFNGENLLSVAEQRGHFVSFGPSILQSKRLQGMATKYPDELILAESDGPVAFASLKGAGGPSLVPSVVFKLAEVKSTPFEEMAAKLARNSLSYLSAGGKVNHPTGLG